MENKILYFLILLLCLSCKGYKSNEANNNLQNRICVSYSCDSIIFDKVSTPTQVVLHDVDNIVWSLLVHLA